MHPTAIATTDSSPVSDLIKRLRAAGAFRQSRPKPKTRGAFGRSRFNRAAKAAQSGGFAQPIPEDKDTRGIDAAA